jgi:hypothetical protein
MSREIGFGREKSISGDRQSDSYLCPDIFMKNAGRKGWKSLQLCAWL